MSDRQETTRELIAELLRGYGYEPDPYAQAEAKPNVRLTYCTSYRGTGEEDGRAIHLHVGGGRLLTLRDGLEINPAEVSCPVDIEDLAEQIAGARKWLADGPQDDDTEVSDICPTCGAESLE